MFSLFLKRFAKLPKHFNCVYVHYSKYNAGLRNFNLVLSCRLTYFLRYNYSVFAIGQCICNYECIRFFSI